MVRTPRSPAEPDMAPAENTTGSDIKDVIDLEEDEDCGECAHQLSSDDEVGDEYSSDLKNTGEDTNTPASRVAFFGKNNVYKTNARDGVNLRAGPGSDFATIRSLPLGTQVHLIRQEGRWGQIDEQGDGVSDGFLHLAFLEEISVGSRTFTATPADKVRNFWIGRNPRRARLYDKYGNALVDPHLLHASSVAAVNFESQNAKYRIEMYGPGGGLRSGGKTKNHTVQPTTGRGAAMDFVLIDQSTGKMLTNHPGRAHQHQGTVGQNAPLYQKYYNEVVKVGSQLYPRFEEMARFGGYFASGDNAMDTMHIDMRGLDMKTAGGKLRTGFSQEQMKRWHIPENWPYK